MGRLYDTIDDSMRQWIAKQPMFFVGTAPDDPDGHVNVSPKGGPGVFRVLGPNRVAYVDLVGSGVETVAHLQENGRIVVMFCAFAGPPKIVRTPASFSSMTKPSVPKAPPSPRLSPLSALNIVPPAC